MRQWAAGQDEKLNIFRVVDMHAITVRKDPKTLAQRTKEIAAILLAAGIDPQEILVVCAISQSRIMQIWAGF